MWIAIPLTGYALKIEFVDTGPPAQEASSARQPDFLKQALGKQLSPHLLRDIGLGEGDSPAALDHGPALRSLGSPGLRLLRLPAGDERG